VAFLLSYDLKAMKTVGPWLVFSMVAVLFIIVGFSVSKN